MIMCCCPHSDMLDVPPSLDTIPTFYGNPDY